MSERAADDMTLDYKRNPSPPATSGGHSPNQYTLNSETSLPRVFTPILAKRSNPSDLLVVNRKVARNARWDEKVDPRSQMALSYQ